MFHSNSYKGYRLGDKGALFVTEGEPQREIEQDAGPTAQPEDVFDEVNGRRVGQGASHGACVGPEAGARAADGASRPGPRASSCGTWSEPWATGRCG